LISILNPQYSKQFKKDIKRYEHQKAIMLELRKIIECLLQQQSLEQRHCDHLLSGNWVGHRECHVKPDLLLIYQVDDKFLFLERLGSHSELFK
jgi:mRNA interferase YafQ